MEYIVAAMRFLAALLAVASFAADRTVVRPKDTGAALINPGMGWVLHHYDNSLTAYGSKLAASDTVDDFPGASVVYLRLAWSYIEPEEGHFNWSVVDAPAQRWIARGKQVAFRFTASEGDPAYATPRWVQSAGAKGYHFRGGKGIDPTAPAWEPNFDDPVFLDKLDHFLTAAAARYDGSPEVAFIDVGSFGIWGEGHTFWSTKLPYSAATVRRHIDLYRKHFKRTLLAANDDFASQRRGIGTIEYARSRGLTLRDDSIMVECGAAAYKSAALAEGIWQRLPVILESEHYGPSQQRGCWGDGSKYIEAVEAYHASYASVHWWPREFLEANRALVARMNRRLGYRLHVEEASWPGEARAGTPADFVFQVRNAGAAPCYPGGHIAFTLKDDEGGIVAVFVDEGYDVRALKMGPAGQAEIIARTAAFQVPRTMKPGVYQVFVSTGTSTGTPKIAMPLRDDDGQRRYLLGLIKITNGK